MPNLDNIYNPDICPSSLDEEGEPTTPGETEHKWDDTKDPAECAECGTTWYKPAPPEPRAMTTDELRALRHIVTYLYRDEQKHFHEAGSPAVHAFRDVCILEAYVHELTNPTTP